MKTTHLLNSFLVLVLLLGNTPIARTAEPPSTLDDVSAAFSPLMEEFVIVDELVELQDEPFSVLSDSSPPGRPRSASAAQFSTSDWHIECMDCPRRFFRFSGDRSLQLDSAERPHIAYSGNGLHYAWHDGTRWHVETVEQEVAVIIYKYTSLALNVDTGYPHISYSAIYSDRPDELKHAWYDKMDWHVETVDWDVEEYTSMALDRSGHPHISYYGGGNLKYAWHDGADWHIETVDSEGDVGEYTSLALNEAGRPCISYLDGSSDVLKYAWHDGTAWHIETVDDEGDPSFYASLVLDATGHPHISYYDYSFMDLKYAWYDGADWHTEIVDSDGVVGEYNSLALDAIGGHPHISYYGGGNLKYAWHDGTEWHLETAVSGEAEFTSLALDSSGYPHISYTDIDNLKYVWYDGTVWHMETVDSEGEMGGYNSLALDMSDRPHVSYHDYDNADLKYAWHDETGWRIETVDSEGEVGMFTSLALDRSNRPHISYDDYGNGDLKYAWHDGTDWRIDAVDSGGKVGGYASLALDASSRPHIGYYDYGNADLKYAWHDGTDWRIETVDSEGEVGAHVSLALDALDHPHISYYDSANDAIKYAWRDGADWHIETVVTGDSKGSFQYTSLALDEASQPQISYVYCDWDYRIGCSPLKLYHAWRNGTSWEIETALNSAGAFSNISMALDQSGLPHISYNNTSVGYVWHDGTAWNYQYVNGHYYSRFGSISLALDRLGQPRISFYDEFTTSFLYARQIPSLFLHKQASPSENLRNNDALTYTLTISGLGLNIRLWDPLPPSVRYIPGSITGTVTPTAVYSSTPHAVVWEGTLPTDTVQTVQFQVTLGVTGTGSLDLARPIVNTAWLTDTESGWSVSATVIVNGWRIYVPLVLRDD